MPTALAAKPTPAPLPSPAITVVPNASAAHTTTADMPTSEGRTRPMHAAQ